MFACGIATRRIAVTLAVVASLAAVSVAHAEVAVRSVPLTAPLPALTEVALEISVPQNDPSLATTMFASGDGIHDVVLGRREATSEGSEARDAAASDAAAAALAGLDEATRERAQSIEAVLRTGNFSRTVRDAMFQGFATSVVRFVRNGSQARQRLEVEAAWYFQRDFRTLVVRLTPRIVPSPCDAPCTPTYLNVLHYEYAAPDGDDAKSRADAWLALGAEGLEMRVGDGLRYTVSLLAYDLTQGPLEPKKAKATRRHFVASQAELPTRVVKSEAGRLLLRDGPGGPLYSISAATRQR